MAQKHSNDIRLHHSREVLTDKQEQILQALVTGMNQTESAEAVGVSREYVCRLCHQDHFLTELDRRVMRAKRLLAPRALANVARLASDAKSERIQLDASLGILDRSGHDRESMVTRIGGGDITVIIDLSD
jgi:hypothetical protein